MKRIIVIIALVFLGSYVMAQDQVIGRWKVVKASLQAGNVSKEEKKLFESLKNSFMKSTFEFRADHNFSFNIEMKDWAMKNEYWKYSPKTKSYLIVEWKDKTKDMPLLMEIFVQTQGDRTIFILSETPIILEVQKE
jgi:hypothetical protein